MYVCLCHDIKEQDVRDIAQRTCFAFANLTTTIRSNSASCCKCFPAIKEVIEDENKGKG